MERENYRYSIPYQRATIMEPSNIWRNNLYVRRFLEGLFGKKIDEITRVWVDTDDKPCTEFFKSEDETLFNKSIDLLFRKDVNKNLSIEMEGDNIVLSTDDFVIRLPKAAAVPYLIYSSQNGAPLQFYVLKEDIEIVDSEPNLDFEFEDVLFLVPVSDGFIISMSYEDFGVFQGIFYDSHCKFLSPEEYIKDIMRPVKQEQMCNNWGMYIKYLKEMGKLQSNTYKL